MPRKKPSDIILDRMTDHEKETIQQLEKRRVEIRLELKRYRDRVRARILYDQARSEANGGRDDSEKGSDA